MAKDVVVEMRGKGCDSCANFANVILVEITNVKQCTVSQGRPFTTSEKLISPITHLHSISHQPIRGEVTDTVEMILGILEHNAPAWTLDEAGAQCTMYD